MVIKPRASWLVKVYLISYHYKAFSHDVIAAMHIGVPKQWNCSHVGVSNQSCESWTLFVCTTLSLCSNKFAHADAGHVSKNALQYKGKMLTLSTELTSDCSFAKKVAPFALPSCRSQQPSSMLWFSKTALTHHLWLPRLRTRLGYQSLFGNMSQRSSPEQKAGPGYEFAIVKFNLNLNFIQFVACYQLICT